MAAISPPTGPSLQCQPNIDAGRISGQPPASIYFRSHRERIRNDILSRDDNLRRRLENVEDEYEEIAVEDEIMTASRIILSQEYAMLSDEAKVIYEDQATAEKHQHWRMLRSVGKLIENEESLAQKAEDERKGISSTIGNFPGAFFPGGGGGAAASSGGEATSTQSAPQEELTPPFDKNTLKTKTGKIAAEEYF